MRPQLYRMAATACLLAGFLSTGCCGPMMFHGGCRSGCGEMYIDPWINDPADCCEPCDPCGGGRRIACPNILTGMKSIWGYRYNAGCDVSGGCDTTGCDSCGLAPSCGLEPDCGLEPSCGIEGCGGCATCGGDRQYVDQMLQPGTSIMDTEGLEASRVILPRGRRIYRGGTVATGPTPSGRH